MKPQLQAYFERIGYTGAARPDLATLNVVHRAHALAIPYENLDVYLERPVDQDIERIFHKIVRDGRGGWCYEMNGLLGWALREIGFTVTRHTGGVFRADFGDDALGNHLLHSVHLDKTYVVDVGIGDFIKEPVVLKEGSISDSGRTYRLEQLPDNSWRFHNAQGAMPPSFDFFHEPADEARLAATCRTLQTDSESMFRQNLICQRMTATGVKGLLGRFYTDTDARLDKHLIASEDELHDVIINALGITPPKLDGLWERVSARHSELFD